MTTDPSTDEILKAFPTVSVGLVDIAGSPNGWLRQALHSPEVSAITSAENVPPGIAASTPLIAVPGAPEHYVLGAGTVARWLAEQGPGKVTDQAALNAVETGAAESTPEASVLQPHRQDDAWHMAAKLRQEHALKMSSLATKAIAASTPLISEAGLLNQAAVGRIDMGMSLLATGFSGAQAVLAWNDPQRNLLKKVTSTAGFAASLGAFASQYLGGNQFVTTALKTVSLFLTFIDKGTTGLSQSEKVVFVEAQNQKYFGHSSPTEGQHTVKLDGPR
jgi:hypothetical protein